jgi:hypothetical protein
MIIVHPKMAGGKLIKKRIIGRGAGEISVEERTACIEKEYNMALWGKTSKIRITPKMRPPLVCELRRKKYVPTESIRTLRKSIMTG